MSDSVSEDEILILDLIGFFCPIPIHETRKLLDVSKPGTIVKVICDDPETMVQVQVVTGQQREQGFWVFLLLLLRVLRGFTALISSVWACFHFNLRMGIHAKP